ncbi:MAG: GAF domain-containing protein, partial [Candidatus Binatia bacterium]
MTLELEREVTKHKWAEKERARLLAETKLNLKHISALHAVTATASQSLDLDTVLQEVIKKITEIFRFNGTTIFLLDTQTGELHRRASYVSSPENYDQPRVFQRGQGIPGRVAETGKPLIFEDVQSDPLYLELSISKAAQKAGYKFLAQFPIKSKQKIVGIVVCLGKDTRHLMPEEIGLITSMSSQIGIAVENAQLYEDVKRKSKELSALYSIATVVNQSLDIKSVLRSVMHKILEIFSFDAARTRLLSEDGKELRLLAQIGTEHIPPGVIPKIDGSLTGNVFQTGTPYFFEDIQNDPEYHRLALRKLALKGGFRSNFIIPIRVKNKILGVMLFFSKKPHRFSSNEVELVHSIADHVGIAVENSQLYEQTKQQAVELEKSIAETEAAKRELEIDIAERKWAEEALQARYNEIQTLHEISQSVLSLPDLKAALEIILDKALSIGNFDIGSIRLLEPDRKTLKLVASQGYRDPENIQRHQDTIVIVTTGGRTHRTLTMNHPRIEEDIQRCEGLRALKREGVQSAIMVPVRVREEVLGVIRLGSRTKHKFQPNEIRLLEALGNHVGIAVQKARLYEETLSKAKELSALYSVATVINQTLDIESVLRSVMYKVLEIFAFDAARIRLLSDDGKELILLAEEGAEKFTSHSSFPSSRGFNAIILKSGKPFFFEDMQNDPEYHRLSYTKEALKAGFRANFRIPISIKDRIVGVMSFYSKESHRFSPNEVELVKSIANHLGIAIENAQLYEQTKRQAVE